jgi:O-antigen ligase
MLLAGRASAWGTHLDIIVEHPLTGMPEGSTWDFGEYGFAEVGRSGTVGDAHNTVVQFGSIAGIPAMLLFLYTAFAPLWFARRAWQSPAYQPLLVMFGVMFLGMLGLSVAGWKSFWALHAIACETNARVRTSTSARDG